VDPGGLDLLGPHERDHGPEMPPAFGEVPGAVHGIDKPHRCVLSQQAENRRVRRGGLLADHDRARQEARQLLREPPFGLEVGDGDVVAGRLLPDIAMGELLEPGNDFLGHDGADKAGDGVYFESHSSVSSGALSVGSRDCRPAIG
jgi:hypothetical protein